jgi:hypothetical protein
MKSGGGDADRSIRKKTAGNSPRHFLFEERHETPGKYFIRAAG